MELTIGKRRGLQSTANQNQIFTVLAFDHRQSFVKMLPADTTSSVGYSEVVAAKLDVIEQLSPFSSAVLLDPLYGASQAIARDVLPAKTGLLVALEKTGYSGDSTARVTELIPEWTVEKIKQMGADAVKLLIYYHPDAGELTDRQDALTAKVIEACHKHDIAFFLEPVSYSIDPDNDKNSPVFAASRPDVIVNMAKRLGQLGPDVLKLEFPVDSHLELDRSVWADACEAVTLASPCPWTVLSAGVDFELFSEQVEVACKAGASGYIAGRAVWKEGIPMQTEERIPWLKETAAKRLEKLSVIADKYAQPWTKYYSRHETSEFQEWFKTY
jgi:tagatose 1,6-diphosphate aldolase